MLNEIEKLIEDLILEGEAIRQTKWSPSGNWLTGAPVYVDLAKFTPWKSKCQYIANLFGDLGHGWKERLSTGKNSMADHLAILGVLVAIKDLGVRKLLRKTKDIVLAEAFDSLLEQANYLLENGYFLAAGVLYRAVLEEHLRDLCDKKGAPPVKDKPTLNDYSQSLYKQAAITKTDLKWLESLATIGNDAAHNKPSLTVADVQRLKQDMPLVIQRIV